MSEVEEVEDEARALEVFAGGLEKLPSHSRYRHKELGLFREEEARQLDELQKLFQDYLLRPKAGRPLSIAVFGAPGSGKSRLVKTLPKMLGDAGASLAPLAEINLTQVQSVDDLATGLSHAIVDAGQQVPFVFFDEFDARHAGAPWGWLSWFLAPMQDGQFRVAGRAVPLKRAVLVFAGGTAPSFERFSRRRHEGFVVAKGPDFVSRLRGHIDIPGVNHDHGQALRRAAVAKHLLKEQSKEVDDELQNALLYVGRFKHGARSMEATIDLLPRGRRASVADVGGQGLLKMHVDRGPLDPTLIGGCIGLSAGTGGDDPVTAVAKPWLSVSRALFQDGATLAYGGRLAASGNLTQQLEQAVKHLPARLEAAADVRIVTSTEDGAPAMPDVERLPRPGVAASEVPPGLDDEHRARWQSSLELFRMRHQLALRSVAQFAIGGQLDAADSKQTLRFPGVAEELMLALALGHPIYVAGAFGGGAAWAGVLLGLGRQWTGLPLGFREDTLDVRSHAAAFRPPPLVDLPLRRDELVEFFQRRALGGSHWIDNGLSPEENRRLFETKDPGEIARLVRRGLRARFDPDRV
jgi:hypothetical protein